MSAFPHELEPSAEHRFFIYDPHGNGFLYFATAEARDQARNWVIQSYLDDGWDDTVEQVVAGEVTQACQQVGREERPDDSELDENDCAGDGTYWGDFTYRCNYALLPLPAPAPEIPDLILPRVTVEGDDLVIRFTVDQLCHSVTMGDCWPVQCDGQSAATIVDRSLFLQELSSELLREDEQGATPLHRLFDAAAVALIENGSEAVELHEDEGDDE